MDLLPQPSFTKTEDRQGVVMVVVVPPVMIGTTVGSRKAGIGQIGQTGF